jgi:hypothetical protein
MLQSSSNSGPVTPMPLLYCNVALETPAQANYSMHFVEQQHHMKCQLKDRIDSCAFCLYRYDLDDQRE